MIQPQTGHDVSYLACDRCPEVVRVGTEDVEEVRQEAHTEGWRYVDGQDVCAGCVGIDSNDTGGDQQ